MRASSASVAMTASSTMMPAPAAAVTSILYRIVSIAAEMVAAGLSILLVRGR